MWEIYPRGSAHTTVFSWLLLTNAERTPSAAASASYSLSAVALGAVYLFLLKKIRIQVAVAELEDDEVWLPCLK